METVGSSSKTYSHQQRCHLWWIPSPTIHSWQHCKTDTATEIGWHSWWHCCSTTCSCASLVGCIYAPYKVNPNIFQFYFDFPDIFHHTSMHPLFRNIYEFYLIFYDFISLSILILFGARFANTFPRIMPRVEIKAVYEIIVCHALEQGICTLNHAIPASPPQCLTVTEEVSLLLFF